ncbi:MAG: hypothetical protein ACK521_07190 [bacterium]
MKQRRIFQDLKSIDSDGYIQTAELRKIEEDVHKQGGDLHLARLEYFNTN